MDEWDDIEMELGRALDTWQDQLRMWLPLPPMFNQKVHDGQVENLKKVVEELTDEWEYDLEDEEMDDIFQELFEDYCRIADDIRYSASCLPLENDICAICLDEESTQPVFCLLCLKVVGCKACICEWVCNSEEVLNCLRCQRSFLKALPCLHYATIEGSSDSSVESELLSQELQQLVVEEDDKEEVEEETDEEKGDELQENEVENKLDDDDAQQQYEEVPQDHPEGHYVDEAREETHEDESENREEDEENWGCVRHCPICIREYHRCYSVQPYVN